MSDVHTCEECGKRLATIGGLEIHMEMAHKAAPRPTPELEAFGESGVDMLSQVADPSPPMGVGRPAPAPRLPRAPFLGGIDPAEPLAWVLTVLLFVGGVVAAIHRPHPPSDITNAAAVTPIPATTTTTADPVAEEAIVKGALLGPSELGGWTVVSSRTIPADELAAPDPCLSDPALTDVTAGAEQSLQYSTGRPAPARLDITIVRTPSAGSAAAQLAATKKPEYVPCVVKTFEAGVREGGGGAVHVRNTEEVPAPAISVTIPASVHRLVTHAYGDSGGHVDITTDDFILSTGRTSAHLFFAAVGSPLAPANEARIVQAVVQHLMQAPGA